MVVGRVGWLGCSVWSEVMDSDEKRETEREVILERGKNKKNEEKKK